MFIRSTSHFSNQWWPWDLTSKSTTLANWGEDGKQLRWFGGRNKVFFIPLKILPISSSILISLSKFRCIIWQGQCASTKYCLTATLFWFSFHSLSCFTISLAHFSSVIQSCPTLWSHELQHTRPPCPSPAPRVHPNSCPPSRWCHPAISPSLVPFSSCPQSLTASGSFPMSQHFAWGGQSIGISASSSALPMNTQHCSPLGWTG